MEFIGLGVFALVVFVGAWYLSHLMSSTGRNEESDHGGYQSMPSEF
jgi:hypothetical protein